MRHPVFLQVRTLKGRERSRNVAWNQRFHTLRSYRGLGAHVSWVAPRGFEEDRQLKDPAGALENLLRGPSVEGRIEKGSGSRGYVYPKL